MITPRKLWLELRWPLLSLLVMVCIGSLIGCWTERDRPWTWLKALGIFLNYGAVSAVVWVFVMAVTLLVKILRVWRQTAQTATTMPADGLTPLERLQAEFEMAYPGRLSKKEAPPVPVIPPPNDDNPYSYR